MAITTMDQLVDSLPGQTCPLVKGVLTGTFAAGQIVSLWTAAGQPGAGIAPAGGLTAAVPTSALAGALNFVNPSGGPLSYIGKAVFASTIPGTLIIYDRLVHCAGITAASTTGSFTSFTVTRPDGNGFATELWVECYTANTATAPNIILNYTDQAGTTGNTAGTVVGAAAMPIGLATPVALAAGDTGVRAVASYTKTATTGGVFGVTMIRRLATIPCTLANVAVALDAFLAGMPQVQDNACIAAGFMIGSGTAAPAITGDISIIQG